MFPSILATLTSAADTSGGTALRQLVWSLWTNHLATGIWQGVPTVNLFDAMTAIDDDTRQEFATLLTMPLHVRTDTIRQILHESGEWDRIDIIPAF
jgi:hypothetical protein